MTTTELIQLIVEIITILAGGGLYGNQALKAKRLEHRLTKLETQQEYNEQFFKKIDKKLDKIDDKIERRNNEKRK